MLLGHLRPRRICALPALPLTVAAHIVVPLGFGVRSGRGHHMSVSTIMVRVVVDAVERSGISRDELLGPLNIDAARLAEADGRFDLEEFSRVQERAMDLTRDDALGLHIAERTPDSSFDLIGHVVSHAPTLREAFALCAQFQQLILDESHSTLSETGTTATLQYNFVRSSERSDRMMAEFVVAAFLRFVRVFGGASVVTARVASFEHARPLHHREYARLFGDAARFGQPATALTFDRALLDRAQLHQNPGLYSMLRTQAERALERVTVALRPAEQVERYLRARPPARIPDLSTAAKELGLSARSLRRRLAADATSYRSLVRAALEASAGHMLRDPKHSIQETAHALGFSNVGAFHRAFKRWTGMTPAEYRERPGSNGSDPEK
jgi:AraC-like DNA-binding protein